MTVKDLEWVKIGSRFHRIEQIEYGLVYAAKESITEEQFAEMVMFDNMSVDGRHWYCEYKRLKREFEEYIKQEKGIKE